MPVDRDVPGLIVKFGDYPLHHGGVGAIRSLGRLGVPMYAITEDRCTPAALSRYLRRAFVWPTTGTEEPERLVEGLLRIGREIGRPTVLVPTDEEAAVLIAEHQDALGPVFLFPRVDAKLPRRLASKQGLHELCVEHGVASPTAAFPQSYDEVERFAARARFPVVAKNREAFERRRQPAVNGTTRIESPEALLRLARGWGGRPGVILQEYLPREDAEDWIVHAYFDADSAPLALFTGVKVRSWPPHAGMTANAYIVDNPELADIAARFIKQIGFSGVIDLDLRFDRRDGLYKLLDFNPRMGAQFRIFENEAGIDVVRALHLDLTGRPVPEGEQLAGRRYIVENIDLPALLAYRRSGYTTPHAPARANGTELAWLAGDDPMPFLTMLARFVRPGAKHLYQLWRANRANRANRAGEASGVSGAGRAGRSGRSGRFRRSTRFRRSRQGGRGRWVGGGDRFGLHG
ncbi:carboxylate--amine ligase [Streptomyces sp. HM190]|uniref:carboxylate--amine ligase n=1 Tax=Streptomyces sp. HM190 TaxID=2695266 RepID=UPI003FA7076C